MLYKEFERKLAELGFYAEYGAYKRICIYTLSDVIVARIYDVSQYDLYFFDNLGVLNPKTREKFVNLALEYTSTPVEKRSIEPKYNVVAYRRKRGTPKYRMVEDVYFYCRGYDGWLCVSNDKNNSDEDQQWTIEQIEHYGLENYERIEVKD